MEYVVLDMEWNQAQSYAEMVKDPVFLTGEIIQIGAVKLDEAFQIVDSFMCRVRPEYYTEMHPRVGEITKLTTADLRSGKDFPEAFDAFCEWCGDDFVFIIWGTEDMRILRKNMLLHDIDTSYMPPCYNLQNIFAAQISFDTRQYSLSKAIAAVKEEPFAAHDALIDAKNTALLCRHLDMTRGLSEYTARTESKVGCVEEFVFEEPYRDVADALDDDYVVSFECPECGELIWCEKWVRKSSTILYSLASCEDGQKFVVRLGFKAVADGRVTVKRTVYEQTEELLAQYNEYATMTDAWSKYVISAYEI
jgi:inhibitor of KinA sporulation pathway (predicted exonuclease)